MLSFPTDIKYISDMDVERILLMAGMAVLVIISIVRIKNNIKNGRDWWDGLPIDE